MPRVKHHLASAALAALVASCLPRTSLAAPLRTWGFEPAPEGPRDAPHVEPNASPPEPPLPTMGTPVSPDADATAPVAPPAPAETETARPVVPTRDGRIGLRYVLEGVQIRGNTVTLARVIMGFVPFKPGDVLDVDDKELAFTRFRLLGTGFFRDVHLSLRRGSRRGLVVLVVDVVERNTLLLNDVRLGLATNAEPEGRVRPLTPFGAIDISEQNLAGSGVALGGAIAIADRQLGLRTRISDPHFLRSSWTAEAQLVYNNAKDFFGNRNVLVDDPTAESVTDYAVVAYRRFGGKVSAGHELGSVSTRAFLDYRLEKIDAQLPLAASHKRGLDVEAIDFDLPSGASVLSSLSATVVHDTRDEPFLPSRGWHVLGLVEASLTPLGSDYPYAKLVLRGSRWMPLPWDHVLRLEGIFGSVFGEAPLFEKFYVGDYTDLRPHRALDLAFDRRAAPNFFDTAIAEVRYGDFAARVNAEYRVPLYRGRTSIYGVDVFTSVGLYGVANGRDLERRARGYEGFASVPIDLTFNLGLRADTAAGGISLGIANFIGFIPIRSEGQ